MPQLLKDQRETACKDVARFCIKWYTINVARSKEFWEILDLVSNMAQDLSTLHTTISE